MKPAVFDDLLASRRVKRAIAIVTRLSDGLQAVVDGVDVGGDLALTATLVAEIRQRHLWPANSGICAGDPGLFVRVYSPAPRLIIVGAVHIAQVLAPMAALAGWHVIIIDPRRAFASAERFPGVEVNGAWPDEAMADLAPDSQTAVVTLSHDAKIDDPALAAALDSDAFYVGALGSSRTNSHRLERLRTAGYADQLHRLHAPVGLDLGGRAAGEIAVAILAEIIQVRCRPRVT